MNVVAEPIDDGAALSSSLEVSGILYQLGKLRISVEDTGGKIAVVAFEEVAGFRVLDEGDLLEFWPSCSKPNGWLFEVTGNGWFAQESLRDGFLARDTKKVAEFLVAGLDDCVNILAWDRPVVSVDVQPDVPADGCAAAELDR